jgi:PAS domain S-box-containing protein
MTDCLPSQAELVAALARANRRIAALETQGGATGHAAEEHLTPQKLLAALAQEAPVGIFLTDRAGQCLYVNPRWREMAGLTNEQALGQGWVQGLHPADRQKVADTWQQMVDAKGHWGLVYRFYDQALDRTTWVHGVATALNDAQERLLGYVGMNTDITALKAAEDQLRASRDELTAVVQGIADGVLVMTPEDGGQIVFANEAAVRMSGFDSLDQMLGWHAVLPKCDILDDRGQPVTREQLPGVIAQSGRPAGPVTLHYVDRESGCDWWGTVRATPLFDDSGAVNRVVVLLHDVPLAHQAAQRQQTILGGVQAGIMLQSADGQITFANEVAARIFEMRTDEITGRTSMDTVWQMVDELGQALPGTEHPSMITLRSGEPVRGVVRGLFADDPEHLRWLLIDTEPLKDPASGVLITFQDITPLVAARQSLADSEARYRAVVEALPDGIGLADLQGDIVLCNTQMATLFGVGTSEELVGRSFYELIGEKQAEIVRAGLARAEYDARVFRDEIECARKDGTAFLAKVSSAIIRDGQGAPRYLLGVLRDITESKQMEARLREAQKLETVGRLAGGVAHEFNNLLTVINGYSELAMRDLDHEHPVRYQLQEIARAGARAAELTHQLLAYSRRQMLRRELLNLDEIVERLAGLLRPTLSERVALILELSGGGMVLADRGQIEEVVLNLVENAHDAMPDGGRLLLRTSQTEVGDDQPGRCDSLAPGRYLTLEITDSGHGMSPEVLSHLFEPFFTTKGVGQGTGLGLATVYGIVKQLGGDIRVASSEGQGTSFFLCFPLVA